MPPSQTLITPSSQSRLSLSSLSTFVVVEVRGDCVAREADVIWALAVSMVLANAMPPALHGTVTLMTTVDGYIQPSITLGVNRVVALGHVNQSVVIPPESLGKEAIPSASKDMHAAQPLDYGFAVVEMVPDSLVTVLRMDLLATLVMSLMGVKVMDKRVAASWEPNVLRALDVSILLANAMSTALLITGVTLLPLTVVMTIQCGMRMAAKPTAEHMFVGRSFLLHRQLRKQYANAYFIEFAHVNDMLYAYI